MRDRNPKIAMFLRRLLETVTDLKKATQEAIRQTKADQDRQYTTQNSIRKAAWSAFGAAVIYASVAAWQACEMRRATDVTHEALTSVQRAFVNVGKNMQDNAVFIPGQAEIQTWEFRPRLENSGVTPTRNARNHANFVRWDGPLPENFPFPDLGQPARDIPFILGPKEAATGALLEVPFSEVRDVRDKKRKLYFYGWISYEDIFPKTTEHVSMFCIELTDVRGELKPNTPYQLAWGLCPRHNCADSECNGEPYGTPTRVWQSQ
jgi:hypothetical protein